MFERIKHRLLPVTKQWTFLWVDYRIEIVSLLALYFDTNSAYFFVARFGTRRKANFCCSFAGFYERLRAIDAPNKSVFKSHTRIDETRRTALYHVRWPAIPFQPRDLNRMRDHSTCRSHGYQMTTDRIMNHTSYNGQSKNKNRLFCAICEKFPTNGGAGGGILSFHRVWFESQS